MNLSATNRAGALRWLAVALGVSSFIAVLTVFNFTDGDIWAKLILGAHVWIKGSVLPHDIFAFTPVLPEYIDHEWGSGLVFYTFLKWFGPDSLMVLKILLAFGALVTAMMVGRILGCNWNALLALAIPCGACILPAYTPVLRSHTFTFFFFGLTLLCLEKIRAGKKWPAFAIPLILLAWANVHGGVASGLGTVGIYTAFALIDFSGESTVGPRGWLSARFKLMFVVMIACLVMSVINPYGFRYWGYLMPALVMNRTVLTEWQSLPAFGGDVFLGFRILFALVVVILLLSWRQTEKKSWPGLFMLALTAVLPWHSRRHGAFFGVATLAFVGPFATVACTRLAAGFPQKLRDGLNPALAVVVLYSVLAGYVAIDFLPKSSFQVLSPVGLYPVRETDILARAEAEGNLAVPFWMGSYTTWRLYPQIKVSMDGRYEATYPESSFRLNEDFFQKNGTNWDRLIREYPVDYVILDFATGKLRPQDLTDHGYVLIWQQDNHTALMVLEKHAAKLRQVAAELPPTTIEPLDPTIPEKWWAQKN